MVGIQLETISEKDSMAKAQSIGKKSKRNSMVKVKVDTKQNQREIQQQRWTVFVFNHVNAHKIVSSS